ncbi:glycosyltransferase family 4 protein [Anabaenopsis elenkinii]|uniref:Glycosyltransferase family 4 protein n=1 Tax=Anabaenopsis elenkinii CCIBt3563 TaxID=2779889 RepID=A0A7S6RDV2_9CYAN|nr:glycosyltransferase family 4 protein [Anabaenopsis elenkinii]QOV23036.1 glycosyltransferase family 4 protein [Anabaenopsis elenkinii CCIBt3563]
MTQKQIFRVTVLDMQPIDPPIGGGRLRLLGLYHGMGECLPTTYIGSYDWEGEKYRHHRLSKTLEEIDIPLSEQHFVECAKLQSRLGGKTIIDSCFNLLGHHSSEFVETAKSKVAESDIVIFSHPWVYPLVKDSLRHPSQLVVYDSQNVEGLLRTSLLDDGGLGTEIAQNVVSIEYALCHNCDLILACSQEDRELFNKLYNIPFSKIAIVPNGVFTDKIPYVSGSQKKIAKKKLNLGDTPMAIFMGSSYLPNIEAARFIIDELAPALPNIHFAICGGVCDQFSNGELQQRNITNVILTGFLKESEKLNYLAASDLAINPMFSGSGTNIKMFDFMAAGLPVISTPIGARGILQLKNPTIHICNENEFINGIQKVLQDHDYAKSLSQSARNLVEKKYSWEKISSNLGMLLCKKYLQQKKYISSLHQNVNNQYNSHQLNELSNQENLVESSGKSQKIYIVSTYPPEHCGIASYGSQLVAYLVSQGHQVTTVSVNLQANADIKLNLGGGINPIYLLFFRWKCDQLIINYHRSFFFKSNRDTIITNIVFLLLYLIFWGKISIICHEAELLPKKGLLIKRLYFLLEKLRWLASPKVFFHTKSELIDCASHYGLQETNRLFLLGHGNHFQKHTLLEQSSARTSLQLSKIKENTLVFLCIGFVQHSKGFDRVVDVFNRLSLIKNTHLYVVGSIRVETEADRNYMETLKEKAHGSEYITIIEKFLSDEEFDLWISASDYVVCPYRIIWSSSVLARAKLYQKRCIVSSVGGLAEQITDQDFVFGTDIELESIISKIIYKLG